MMKQGKNVLSPARSLLLVFSLLLLPVLIFVPASALAAAQPVDNLIDLSKISLNVIIDLKYATTDNFTGRKLYSSDICCLQEGTAWKLARANREVQKKGYRIKVWDGYRPLSVQKAMWKVVPDARFVANPYKNGSKHNRGAAVDVTLVDAEGRELEMPSAFDEFTVKASRTNPGMTAKAKANLKILTDAMTKSGFRSIQSEWWHYDDTEYTKYALLDIKASEVSKRKLPVEELSCMGEAKQVILVTAGTGTANVTTSAKGTSASIGNSSKAQLAAYESVNGKWVQWMPEVQAFVGKNGFRKVKNAPLSPQEKRLYKYEGDGCTPLGVFGIRSLFGWGVSLGFHLPYEPVTGDDYWVSDDTKELYNVRIRRKGGPDKNWAIYEKLKIPQYKYAAVIDYNQGPDRITGNGSAIFLHLDDGKGYTSGCVMIPETSLLSLLKWLKPEKNPVIIQGPLLELKKLTSHPKP